VYQVHPTDNASPLASISEGETRNDGGMVLSNYSKKLPNETFQKLHLSFTDVTNLYAINVVFSLNNYVTSRRVEGSIPDEVIALFN
jgi:hypothetical protein